MDMDVKNHYLFFLCLLKLQQQIFITCACDAWPKLLKIFVQSGHLVYEANSIGGSKESTMDAPLPGPNSFIFMQFSGKIWPNNRLAAPPPVWEFMDPPLRRANIPKYVQRLDDSPHNTGYHHIYFLMLLWY